MAKRRVQKRFDTKDVQGKDSYVVMSSLRVGERRDYVEKSKGKNFSMMKWGIDILTKHIIEWNWVGDDDEPLPTPRDDPKVMDDMTDEESELLVMLLTNSDTKN